MIAKLRETKNRAPFLIRVSLWVLHNSISKETAQRWSWGGTVKIIKCGCGVGGDFVDKDKNNWVTRWWKHSKMNNSSLLTTLVNFKRDLIIICQTILFKFFVESNKEMVSYPEINVACTQSSRDESVLCVYVFAIP